jgi:hypothetical protein
MSKVDNHALQFITESDVSGDAAPFGPAKKMQMTSQLRAAFDGLKQRVPAGAERLPAGQDTSFLKSHTPINSEGTPDTPDEIQPAEMLSLGRISVDRKNAPKKSDLGEVPTSLVIKRGGPVPLGAKKRPVVGHQHSAALEALGPNAHVCGQRQHVPVRQEKPAGAATVPKAPADRGAGGLRLPTEAMDIRSALAASRDTLTTDIYNAAKKA